MRNLTFIRALVVTNLKATLALRGAFAIQVVFMMLNNFTFFVFWWVLMGRVTTLRGWHIGDIELLFGMVCVAFGLTVTLAGGVRHLGRFIDEGDLDTLLTQPKSVLVYALGVRSQPSGVGDFLSGLMFIVWSGQVTRSSWPLVLAGIIAGAIVLVASGIVFYSLAFWMGKVETVARQMWELLITFSLYPEPLFGGALRLVLFTLLPAGFVGYLPARIVRAPSMANVALLAFGTAAYLVFAVQVFERGLRRYASGSRFSTFG
ncbi:MAG TPA: ABC-2 family transporter protein [Vicinamibacterales bacterium]|jgi:ABC-2 type transport system permease protein|nr:ABC-2 family transporter protein [Vicinamibacterales bacterium]